MREIALHLLDIAENSVAAQAHSIEIRVEEDLLSDRLATVVCDDGRGMDAETLARVTDPFVTSRTTRKVGLGIPLFKAAAEACNGSFTITSAIGQGTTVEAVFQHSHIDRMPLGDLPGTLLTLVVAYPQIHWVFQYRGRSASPNAEFRQFVFDDQPIKAELGDLPLCEPAVLAFLRSLLEEGMQDIRQPLLEQALNWRLSA